MEGISFDHVDESAQYDSAEREMSISILEEADELDKVDYETLLEEIRI